MYLSLRTQGLKKTEGMWFHSFFWWNGGASGKVKRPFNQRLFRESPARYPPGNVHTYPHLVEKESHPTQKRQTGKGDTPWKMNMDTNHPFRKENDLPNLHDYVPC